jgi:hypothetical protein
VGLTAVVIAQVPAGRIAAETGQAQVPAIEAEAVVIALVTAAFLQEVGQGEAEAPSVAAPVE